MLVIITTTMYVASSTVVVRNHSEKVDDADDGSDATWNTLNKKRMKFFSYFFSCRTQSTTALEKTLQGGGMYRTPQNCSVQIN